jgi:hypothetical protein
MHYVVVCDEDAHVVGVPQPEQHALHLSHADRVHLQDQQINIGHINILYVDTDFQERNDLVKRIMVLGVKSAKSHADRVRL